MSSVEAYILAQAAGHQNTLYQLREITLASCPCRESIKWKVPFFIYKGPLVYFSKRGKAIEVAFPKGYKMEQHPKLPLLSFDRKTVFSFLLQPGQPIPEELFRYYLMEGILLNEIKPGFEVTISKKKYLPK